MIRDFLGDRKDVLVRLGAAHLCWCLLLMIAALYCVVTSGSPSDANSLIRVGGSVQLILLPGVLYLVVAAINHARIASVLRRGEKMGSVTALLLLADNVGVHIVALQGGNRHDLGTFDFSS